MGENYTTFGHSYLLLPINMCPPRDPRADETLKIAPAAIGRIAAAPAPLAFCHVAAPPPAVIGRLSPGRAPVPGRRRPAPPAPSDARAPEPPPPCPRLLRPPPAPVSAPHSAALPLLCHLVARAPPPLPALPRASLSPPYLVLDPVTPELRRGPRKLRPPRPLLSGERSGHPRFSRQTLVLFLRG